MDVTVWIVGFYLFYKQENDYYIWFEYIRELDTAFKANISDIDK